MAVAKKRAAPETASSATPRAATPTRQNVSLSMEKFVPSQNLFDYNFLIYGQRKIGKTTLANEAEKAYAFLFEPNDSYELYKSDITEWWQFPKLVDQFVAGDHDFRTAIVDTVRPCYNMALDFACKRHGFEHPGGQNDHGMAWSKVTKEFEPPLRKLMSSGYGFIALCHEHEAEIKTRSGSTFMKMQPDMPASAARLLANEVYNIFYYYMEGERRWLQIEPDEYVTAGHRMRGHFLTPAGERIVRIPMGTNEKEAYKNLLIAFNNKQSETFDKKGENDSSNDSNEPKISAVKKKIKRV